MSPLLPEPQFACSLGGTVEELPGFFGQFEQWAETHSIAPSLVSGMGLMLDEMLTNIAMYAYQSKGGPVAVRIQFEPPCRLDVVLRDRGPFFDPTRVAAPDVGAALEDRKIGGLGVHFVRNMSENLTYRRDGEFNEVRFSRSIAQAQ